MSLTANTTALTSKVKHIPGALCPSWMKKERTRLLSSGEMTMAGAEAGGCIVYWMQRDVRTADNWALLLAAHWAQQQQLPLRVLYALPPPPPPATKETETETIPNLANLPMTERHGKFLLGGLECVYNELKAWNVPLDVVLPKQGTEHVGDAVFQTLKDHSCRILVTDMAPLRHHRQWTEHQAAPLLENAQIPFVQVDAHNVVPVWVTSSKREYAARTIRPKIHKHYNQYLQKFPKIGKDLALEHQNNTSSPEFKLTLYQDFMQMDSSVPDEGTWLHTG